MPILNDIKTALRISINNTAFDSEITDLIAAARGDLMLAGILPAKANDDNDPLIKRAIVVYCKANFGYDNSEAERFQQSYDMLKAHLTLSLEYTAVSDGET